MDRLGVEKGILTTPPDAPQPHVMTSAYLPKYLPPGLIHFINTRGRGKLMWASDHPAIPMERCLASATELDLRDGVLDRYLYANAHDLFFAK